MGSCVGGNVELSMGMEKDSVHPPRISTFSMNSNTEYNGMFFISVSISLHRTQSV